jgi:hypothetical protein
VGQQLLWILSKKEKFVAFIRAVKFTIYYLTIQTQTDCAAHLACYTKLMGFLPGGKAARTQN